MRYPVAVALIILVLACFSGCATTGTRAYDSPYIWNLLLDGFMSEMMFGFATARTPHFDAYTVGSYHVDKKELMKEAEGREEIESVIVIGPNDPLWSYDIITLVKHEDAGILNRLVFAHARITLKMTRVLRKDEFTEFTEELTTATTTSPGNHAPPDSEFSTSVAVGLRVDGVWHQVYFSDKAETTEAVEPILKLINKYLADSVVTYRLHIRTRNTGFGF